MAIGYGNGNIYIYEKLGPGNDFAPPVLAGTWGDVEGYFAKDLAVADFNEDGNADFVLSLDYSNATGLYLGDGNFGFESSLLPGTEAYLSAGADAADFNNDRHADFVVATTSGEDFYVSLGDGQGGFETWTFASADGCVVYGVAAADFTGDGNADIVAACFDYLYVYEGAGDGKTFTYKDRVALPINQSAIDNHDFNGDGNQDLVVADYDGDPDGVAFLAGNGDGTFTYSGTFLGGTAAARNALSGPPYAPITNEEPEAVISLVSDLVTAGEEIVFSGSKSTDNDGTIVSYEWTFGDEDTAGVVSSTQAADPADPAEPSHVYYETGFYTVTLVVTDDKGAKSTATVEIQVEPVPVTVKISPSRLNLKSHGKWIVATIKLPQDYDPKQVDRDSISVVVGDSEIAAQPSRKHGFFAKIWGRIQCRMKVVSVKFDRQKVIEAIGDPSDSTELVVVGKVLHNGGLVEFIGSDTIKTYEKSKKWGFFKKSKKWGHSKKSKGKRR
jgi:hypothetical protein